MALHAFICTACFMRQTRELPARHRDSPEMCDGCLSGILGPSTVVPSEKPRGSRQNADAVRIRLANGTISGRGVGIQADGRVHLTIDGLRTETPDAFALTNGARVTGREITQDVGATGDQRPRSDVQRVRDADPGDTDRASDRRGRPAGRRADGRVGHRPA